MYDELYAIGKKITHHGCNINTSSCMTAHFSQPLLFEMLRSFTTLARVLNLSKAVRELNSTRQTVRRHISQLEEMKGGPLFELVDRQYRLTELGQKVLPEARDLLARAEGWATGHSSMIGGLQHLRYTAPEGWMLCQQQHPLGRIFQSDSPLLRNVLQAWAMSNGELEHEAMNAVRPYLMVFRRDEEKWLCVEIGEKSSFVSWFGWAKARSSIGREIGGMPVGGANYVHLLNLAYLEVESTQGARLDHTYTEVEREGGSDRETLCYERLLCASRFPDGSFAMVSVVRRTKTIEVQGVTQEMKDAMPQEMVM